MAITQLISYTARNVGATTATVFTAQAEVQTVISGLTVANTTAVATSASVLITRGTRDVYLVKGATVYPGGSMVVAGWDQKIALIAGDQLKAQSSVANAVDVVVSAVLSGEAAAGAQPFLLAADIASTPQYNNLPNDNIFVSILNLTPATGLVYWTIEGTDITAADFTAISGATATAFGAGGFNITPTFKAWNKSFRVQIRTGSIAGPIIATSPDATLLDLGITTTGLVLNLDAGVSKSYPGSGTTWTDITGNGYNGTLVNGPTYTTANGGAIVLDGTNDYVSTTGMQNFAYTAGITVSAWHYNGGSTGYYRGIATNGTIASRSGGFDFRYGIENYYGGANNGTNLGWTITNASGISTYIAMYAPVNEWHYYTATYDNSVLRVYKDGVLFGSIAHTAGGQLRTMADSTTIGSSPGTLEYLDGKLGHISIYNRALSFVEILANFNGQRGRYGI